MSCVGGEHPDLEKQRQHFQYRYGVQLSLSERSVEIWSWDRLAQELNFCGCELLIVDTEGHDVSVLRSMIEYCTEQTKLGVQHIWPNLIQFESMGFCDRVEGDGA